MKIKYKGILKNDFFLIVLLFAVIIVVFLSYNRFIVRHDYIVGYEGECDPTAENCFVGCEDDTCTNQYYYTKMQKYAPDLYKECGKDITDCETASVCLLEDRECSITYCDSEADGDICATVGGELKTQDNDQNISDENEPLQNDNVNDLNI